MGKRKIYIGMIVGAVVGGLTALVNKDAREYAKDKLINSKEQTKYFLQHPQEAIANVKESFEQFSAKITDHAESTVKTLDQIEGTLERFSSCAKENKKSDE